MSHGTVRNTLNVGTVNVNVRCPVCRRMATFEEFGIGHVRDIGIDDHAIAGQRRCPNEECRAHVFFIKKDGEVTLYPPEFIDFDTANVPEPVASCVEEAIVCHAHAAYRAAAIMVRRSLEELCSNKGATGANLAARLKALAATIILPKELVEALDQIRLLGNDAAHIESQHFAQVSRVEVEAALTLLKEVVKATYQYDQLLQSLKSLRSDQPDSTTVIETTT